MFYRNRLFGPLSQRRITWILALVLTLQPIDLRALPDGAQVQHGQVNIGTNGTTMTIDQASQMAVVNWNGFSINANELVKIQQLASDSALLNRVTGADPSKLLGQLSANGRVYVINPNGVLVGGGARINTQQFIASALDVADQDFLNGGDLMFEGDSTAPVVNLGEITAANGDVILVAQVVRNEGEISAPDGTAALAAGNEVLFQPDAKQKVVIAAVVSPTVGGTGVTNTGLVEAAQAELKAAGGHVYDLAINQEGIIRATGVETKNGRVLLTSDGGSIRHDGTISARNADGSGGEVLIGGDYRGANEAVANAEYTKVTSDAVIDVSANSAEADAGRTIVWANQQTDFAGKIEGQGGVLGGDGAFAEVSGKHILNYSGLADLSAENGATGTLLLDPDQAIISTAADDQPNGAFNNSVLATNLGSANVIVDASTYGNSTDKFGEIIVNAPVTWASGNTLTLKAANTIAVNADLTGTGGDVVLLTAKSGGGGGSSVTLDSGATITADSLSIGQNPDAASPGTNLQPLANRTLGAVNLAGVIDVTTLDLRLDNRGIEGDVTVNNAANKIGTITTSVTDGSFTSGDLEIVDSDGGLTIDGDLSSTAFNHGVTISTPGDLTLASGAKVSAGDTNGTVVLASTGGSFINNAGASAVSSGSGGSSRYLIYSDDPADTTKGGLTALPVYNKTHAANAPGTITQTGNRFLYSLAPTLTFTADDLSRGENTANPTLTYTVTGLVGGDSEAQAFSGVPSLSTTAVPASAAGDYTITLVQNTVAASDLGYGLSFANGTLTIDLTKIINIKANDFSRYYGDANPTFTYTPSGFVGGDDASILSGFTVNFSTTAVTTSPAGTFAIVPSGAATVSDYDVTYQNGTLTIDPRLLTITADDKSMNFLDSKPTNSATWSGLASFDTEADVPGLAFTDNYNNHAGTFTITPSGASNANYAITFVNGTLTVNPRPVTATVRSMNRDYGDTNPTFAVSYSGMPFGNPTPDTTGLSVTTTATQNSGAGDYAITASGISNPDYAITYVPGTLTIDPAAFSVQANNATREYADANPAFTSTNTGFKLSDTITDVVPDLHFTSTASLGSNAGTYTITPTGTPSANYDVSFLNGALTVTKAPISLFSLGTTHRDYGDANPSSYSVNVVGLKNGDTLAGGAIQYFTSTTANSLSGVGNYAVNFDVVSSVNYSIPTGVRVPGTLRIDPRPLTITADSFTREYGDANPTLKASFDNLASFDTAASVFPSMTITTPATQSSNVLDYGINIFNATHANYDVTTVPGTLSVTKAPINFTGIDFEFFYGEPVSNAVFANYQSGLKLTDSLEDLRMTVDAGGAKDVGTYPVNITLGNPNYSVGAGAGTVKIKPRPIVVNIWDAQRYYGDPLTKFVSRVTGTYGLVDPANEVYRVVDPSTMRSDTGYYFVTAESVNPNYEMFGVNRALLTVLPRPISIKPANAGFSYGDDFQGVDYLVSGLGLAPFDTIDDVVADTVYRQITKGTNHGFAYDYSLVEEGKGAQFLGSLIRKVPGFGVTIKPGGYETRAITRAEAYRNYYITNVPGSVSVVPRAVSITVNNATGVRNHPLELPFSATVDNLAPADEAFSYFDALFPGVLYELTPITYAPEVQRAVPVSDVPLASGYTDREFYDQFNPRPALPPITDSSTGDTMPTTPVSTGSTTTVVGADGGTITATSVPILISADDPEPTEESQPITFTSGGTVTVTSKTVLVADGSFAGDGVKKAKTAPVDYRLIDQLFSIRARHFTNDNYVVTGINMGTLTVTPDPEEVAAIEERTRMNTLREQFLNPTTVSGGMVIERPMALGLDRDSIAIAMQALNWMIENPYEGGEDYAKWIELQGRKIAGVDGYSEVDYRIAYLSDLHTNGEKQARMAGVLKKYGMAMLKGDVPIKTEAQKAFKAKMQSYVDATREALAKKIKEKEAEFHYSKTAKGKEEIARNKYLASNQQARADALVVKDKAQALIAELKEGKSVDIALSEFDGVLPEEITSLLNSVKGAGRDAAVALLETAATGARGRLKTLKSDAASYSSPAAIQTRVTALQLANNGNSMAGTLLAGDVPYAEIMTDAVGDVVEDSFNLLLERSAGMDAASMALGAAGGAAGAGATLATVAAVGGAVFKSAIFIHSTASATAYVGAAAGGGAGIGFGIGVGIARGIQIGKMINQEAYMNQLVNNPTGTPLNLKPKYDVLGFQTNSIEMQLDTAVVNTALMAMFSGAPTYAL